MENIFKGVITALITPFHMEKLDLVALGKLINFQIDNGIEAIVIAGATGEGPCLSMQEYEELVAHSVEIAAERIKIIASLFSCSTQSSIEQASIATKYKADGLMAIVPPYVRPTSEGLFEHFRAIHESTSLPIMLYTSLSRSGTDLQNDVIFKLSKLARIQALKYSGHDLERVLILSQIPEFNILTGDDAIFLACNAQGGRGVVSVVSNIMPRSTIDIQQNWQRGDFSKALKIHQELFHLYEALFNESNPIAIKYAASKLKLCDNELRLPLMSASNDTMYKIDKALQELGL